MSYKVFSVIVKTDLTKTRAQLRTALEAAGFEVTSIHRDGVYRERTYDGKTYQHVDSEDGE